ncbi:FAD-dependent oxidoreductase [Crocosphaera sp. XPORK-15E]|uniref:FAD-dependent oxidoreductase n=1 Tax=Crocosphaera sp. XPORK-15E TaxID=3110247 RepID=UPI002B205215|nr:FAD-dependent oxidoreductase [Crocosphaera sp. XPORK-15E]MEA5536173.1 FAD-dependent oxidoreductase [Crocosphaera sp. XPORK-15E]
MGQLEKMQQGQGKIFSQKTTTKMQGLRRILAALSLGVICLESTLPVLAAPPRNPEETINCDILIVGGGLSGAAAAYEGLLAGRTVCLTEITDWIGGQISSQGTSALDEGKSQRSLQYFPKGYRVLRDNITRLYGKQNPGDCWVSESCFLPYHGHQLLYQQLKEAEQLGRGTLKWFPSTVIKQLEISDNKKLINGAIAIQHNPKVGIALNQDPLSKTIEDAYNYKNSDKFNKKIIRFQAKSKKGHPTDWFVVEATETGEIVALADVPYRIGLDPRSYLNPSSPTEKGDPYCVQGFTYPFAMERTATPQPQYKPPFYEQYQPYYGYDSDRRFAYFDLVFTYRRIWSPQKGQLIRVGQMKVHEPTPGDISMQNWLWGNDYRPGTSQDNLIYTHDQLEKTGQLQPGGWKGGLRTETLRKGEEISLGFYYWLVAGNTDSRLGYGIKRPEPNHRLLTGLSSPMGTQHGLSKYPYIREGRRIIGRPSYDHPEGFSLNEIDISTKDYWNDFYRTTLPRPMYQQVWSTIANLESTAMTPNNRPSYLMTRRTHATVYPDSVGVTQYMIDFHPCMALSPPEKPGNREREDVRVGQGSAYPAQIPLRAMIPQKVDNLIISGKSIASSHIAAAAYRVHGFEWSVGAAAGTLASFSLEKNVLPYELIDNLPQQEAKLQELRYRLENNGNPTAFPQTIMFDARRP